MKDCALHEVDRQIVETRDHIGVQRTVVRKFNESGQFVDATLAEGILRALETSLRILEERKRAALSQLRQPGATSRATSRGARRRKSSA
jgi:hypothetical protein